MINLTLMLMLLVPLLLLIVSIYIIPKLNKSLDLKISCLYSGTLAIICIAITCIFFYMSIGHQTKDVEVLNGQIKNKERIHGSYVRSYSCNCVPVCTSSNNVTTCTQVCQVCNEQRYTVNWTAYSDIGDFYIDSVDSARSSVYKYKDPAFYSSIVIGEPCSREHEYINYIKASPDSLFRPLSSTLKDKYKSMIPIYPLEFYGTWKLDRVIPVKVNVPDIKVWNNKLSEMLKVLGPVKQVNSVIILVNSDNPDYAYAVQDAWINGKKNDVVLIIGTTNFPQKADWVRVLAFSDKDIFKVSLRDDVLALETLTADNVINALSSNISKFYQRKRMKDWEYLNARISPPDWLIFLSSFTVLFMFLSLWFIVYYSDKRNKNSTF